MNRSTQYLSGEAIHVGDSIRFAGEEGRIVVVIGRDEFESDFVEQKAWYQAEFGRGFLLTCPSLGLVFQEEADEDLVFVSRRDPR